jgi:hypothetical protein
MAVAKRANRIADTAVVDGRAWRLVRDPANPGVTEAFPQDAVRAAEAAGPVNEALAGLLARQWLGRQKGHSDG